MEKHLKSTDPRKARVVAALKNASGCSKVTNVTENTSDGSYSGDCLKKKTAGRGGEWEKVGRWNVKLESAAQQ